MCRVVLFSRAEVEEAVIHPERNLILDVNWIRYDWRGLKGAFEIRLGLHSNYFLNLKNKGKNIKKK